MPSKSRAAHGFAAMSATAAGRAKLRAHGKKPMPESVAKEFLRADRGKHFGGAAKRARKK